MKAARVYNHGRVLFQEDSTGEVMPETAILIHVESGGGCIILQQEDRHICLTREAGNLKSFARALADVLKESNE